MGDFLFLCISHSGPFQGTQVSKTAVRSEVAGKGSREKVVVGRGGLDGGGEGFYFISTFGAKFLAVKTSFYTNCNHNNCHLKVATKMMKRKPGESGGGRGG